MLRTELATLVGSLFETCHNPAASEELLGLMAGSFGANTCAFAFFDRIRGHNMMPAYNFPQSAVDAYVAQIEDDPRMIASRRMGTEAFAVLELDLVDDHKVFRNTELYRSLFAPLDVEWFMGAARLDLGGCDLFLTLNRGRLSEEFSQADKAKVELLLPYLEPALRLAVNQRNKDDIVAVLPQLTVDGEGRLLDCNEEGSRLLRSGGPLLLRNGHLQLGYGSQAKRNEFQTAVARAASSKGQQRYDGFRGVLRGPLIVYRVSIHPVVEYDAAGQAKRCAKVVITSSENVDSLPGLTEVELTDSERAVVGAFLSGSSLKEIARDRNRSIMTIRTQMKSAMKKCGVTTQAQLVRRMRYSMQGQVLQEPPA